MIHPAGARGRFRHDEGRRRHELPYAPTARSSPVLGPVSPPAVAMGPSLGRRQSRGTWGGRRWRGGGPQGGGAAVGVPWGCCDRVNNSSAHRAAYGSAHRPRAGDGGGSGWSRSPPFFLFLAKRGEKVTRKPWPRALAVPGSAGRSPGNPTSLTLIPVPSNNSTFIRRFGKQNPVAAGRISERHKSPRVSPPRAKPRWRGARSCLKLVYLCSATQKPPLA